MQKTKEKYIDNTREIMRLMKLYIGRTDTEEELLRQVRTSAEQVYRLRTENDRILRDEVFSRTAEELSDEDCRELYSMAMECSHFRNSIDAGAAWRIHSLLYKAAVLRGDLPHIIQELYWQGMSLYYINLRRQNIDLDVHGKRIRGYFRRAAAYLEQYDQLPGETRGYIIRSLANCNLCTPKVLRKDKPFDEEEACAIYDRYMQIWSKATGIVRSREYREKNPELPWDVYEYSLHFDRTAFFSLLRQIRVPRIADDLMESAVYVYRHQTLSASAKETTVAARAVACYYMAQYHTGRITGDQLLKRLLELYNERVDPNVYDLSGNYVNMQLPQVMEEYRRLGVLSPDGEARLGGRLDEVRRKFHQYLLGCPYSGYNGLLGWILCDEMELSRNRDNDEFLVRLMDLFVSFHSPTYIHSCMVAYLIRELIARLIEVNPQAADGVLGVPLRQLIVRRNEICDVAWKCGMYHDVGKIMILNFVVTYNRNLLDEEFQIIKLHSELSYALLKKIPGDEDIAEVVLRHHLNYDGKGGYPPDCPPCPPQLQVLVDALTVADSMDAATDNVGRCYAAAKSYDTLVDELFRFRGTRYAPCIVDLFRDRKFRDAMVKKMEAERRQIYCDVYSALDGERKKE